MEVESSSGCVYSISLMSQMECRAPLKSLLLIREFKQNRILVLTRLLSQAGLSLPELFKLNAKSRVGHYSSKVKISH
jgi:hypothetical protein